MEHKDIEYSAQSMFIQCTSILMNVSGLYCWYLIRTIDLFAQNIMQECLEEGKSWHCGVFALFLFALLVLNMAFLHTEWTYTILLHFEMALLHAVINAIFLGLFLARVALKQHR